MRMEIQDDSGAVAGALQTLVEPTKWSVAQMAMRESEAWRRLLTGSWSQAPRETDARGGMIADSPSWRAFSAPCRPFR